MRKFSPFKDDITDGDAHLRVRCPCRFDDTYASLDEFTDAGGEVLSETPLIIRCPRCRNIHVADATREETDRGTDIALDLEVGSDRRELDTFRVGDCPACGSTVRNTDYNEGPDHPDIGWKHYECPACGVGIRPERMGDGV